MSLFDGDGELDRNPKPIAELLEPDRSRELGCDSEAAPARRGRFGRRQVLA
jgi:hypothetical protein